MVVGRILLRRAAHAAASLLVLGAAACGPQRLEKTENDLRSAIAAAEQRGDTATLRLIIEVPFAFDRLYIAGPRTSADSLTKVMGPDWPPEFSRGLEDDDRFHLFVFLVRDQWVPATLPRTVAEVAPELTGRIFGPETAVFRVKRVPGAAAPTLLPQ